MSDFTSQYWSWYIMAIAGGGIVWLLFILRSNSKTTGKVGEPTGHVWDEDLEELNNPLPRWWLVMFYLSIFFAIGYLILYPGMGSYKGLLKWTELGEYKAEVATANAKYGPLFDKYLKENIVTLAKDKKANKMGERLFVTYCAACHGSDARGAPGFPNLRDNDWLYGGEPKTIQTTIMYGRQGTMPAWEGPLGGMKGVVEVANYVMSLSGRKVNEELAAKGKVKFDMFCVGCHGSNGKGSYLNNIPGIGAPNLTDNIWLFGGSAHTIEKTIAKGRSGKMPAHKNFLGKAKVHILAAYIYSLSHKTH